MMHFKRTALEGVYVAEPKVYRDNRGYFMESFRLDLWEETIGPICFIQENESYSNERVLRGLHYQLPPFGQAKLVRVVAGVIRDVVVDMRPHASTFGRYYSELLSGENKKQLFVPAGCAHGFVVLSSEAIVQYKVDAPYAPEAERSLRFDDPVLQIDWGVPAEDCIVSDKDRNGLHWQDAIAEILK